LTDRTESDLDRLRAQHPTWRIDYAWTARSSGPDACRLAAVRQGIRLTDWTAAGLSAQIAAREAAHGWGS
jgi:hypothetical protein